MHLADLIGVNPGRKRNPASGSHFEMGRAFRAGEFGHLHAAGQMYGGFVGCDRHDVVRSDRQGVGPIGQIARRALQRPADAGIQNRQVALLDDLGGVDRRIREHARRKNIGRVAIDRRGVTELGDPTVFHQRGAAAKQQRTALARAIAKESKAVFLDEPLANLDYKLREELRDQLPDLFAGRGAVVVYATSEPEEALLLGGETALMDDGVVTQFGPTAEIYREPATLAAARVFSDPPINAAEITKTGDQAKLRTGVSWTLQGPAAQLPDGAYTVAIRPHHVLPVQHGADDVALNGIVQVTELSGSESSAHFQMGSDGWVSLSAGVHPYQVGEDHQFFMDANQAFYFAPDGRLVA